MKELDIFHNRYELVRLLGRGNFSEVWLAKDQKTGIDVALKIYAPATGLDSHGLNVLSREFAIVVNANHKNLLKPLYYDSFERKPYLVLPYCSRGSILKSIGTFSEEDGWRLLRDVASGLAFLHSMQPVVIHQDIKPDNIMVGDNGTYMITDFGVSTHVKSALRKSVSAAFASAGTIAYMAPERFGKDTTPIMANDIYSLGATAYEMLTGDAPFGENGGLIQKGGAEVPDLKGDFSSALNKVIGDCLKLNSWERPTAEQLEKMAEKGLRGEDPYAEDNESSKSILKSKPFIAVCLVAFIAIAVAMFFLFKTPKKTSADIGKPGEYRYAVNLLKAEKSANEGLVELTKLSENGDSKSIYLLSRLFFKSKSMNDAIPDSIRIMQNNLNVKFDNLKAHNLLFKAIESSPTDYHALYELGCDFLGGDSRLDGVTRDISKADKYLQEALVNAQKAKDDYYVELIKNQINKYKE